jgi:hypothetical protein
VYIILEAEPQFKRVFQQTHLLNAGREFVNFFA